MVLFNHEIFSAFNTYIHTLSHTHTERPSHAHTLHQVGCARVRVLRQKFLLLAAQNKQNQTERNKVDKYLPMYTLSYIHTYRALRVCVCVCVYGQSEKPRGQRIQRATVRQFDEVAKRDALQSMQQYFQHARQISGETEGVVECVLRVCVCCIQCRLCNSTTKEFCSCRCLRKCLSLSLFIRFDCIGIEKLRHSFANCLPSNRIKILLNCQPSANATGSISVSLSPYLSFSLACHLIA